MDEQHLILDAITLADTISERVGDPAVAVELVESDRLGNQLALFAVTAGIGEVTEELRARTLTCLRDRRDHPDPFEGLTS